MAEAVRRAAQRAPAAAQQSLQHQPANQQMLERQRSRCRRCPPSRRRCLPAYIQLHQQQQAQRSLQGVRSSLPCEPSSAPSAPAQRKPAPPARCLGPSLRTASLRHRSPNHRSPRDRSPQSRAPGGSAPEQSQLARPPSQQQAPQQWRAWLQPTAQTLSPQLLCLRTAPQMPHRSQRSHRLRKPPQQVGTAIGRRHRSQLHRRLSCRRPSRQTCRWQTAHPRWCRCRGTRRGWTPCSGRLCSGSWRLCSKAALPSLMALWAPPSRSTSWRRRTTGVSGTRITTRS
mmetsp:Transcript_12097/g.36284  ORF Transcript_12097/g.36284 Transcript_12097/m.36284 type:complete len:285 (-) Transcript_12097:265-1119(-)